MFIAMTRRGPLTPSGVKCNLCYPRHMELLTEFVRRIGCY
jgi:hypothetical protein